MKKWVMLLFFLYGCCTIKAQNINRVEYFFDTDLGVGNGNPISITAGDIITVNNLLLPSAGLSVGMHSLYVRARNNDGWSTMEGFPFYIATIANAPKLTGAEYFFDTDPGAGKATAINIASSADTIKLALQLDSVGLSGGMHALYVRFRDIDGQFSLFESFPFYINDEISNMPKITAAEYFFGADPGVGNATALNISPAGDTVTRSFHLPVPSCQDVNIDSTNDLYVRVKDGSGRWSLFEKDSFKIRGPNTVNTVKAGLWSDASIWSNNKVPDANTGIILKHNIIVDVDASCKYLYTFCNNVLVNAGKALHVNGHP